MTTRRTMLDFPRNEAGLVDEFIGTAYDTVKAVYDNLDEIRELHEIQEQIPGLGIAAVEAAMVPARIELADIIDTAQAEIEISVDAAAESAGSAEASAAEAAASALESKKVNQSFPFTFVTGQSQYNVETISGDPSTTTAGMTLWVEGSIEYAFTVNTSKLFTINDPTLYPGGAQMRLIVNAHYDNAASNLDQLTESYEQLFAEYLDNANYEQPVPYAEGLTLSRSTQTVLYLGEMYRVAHEYLPLVTTDWATDQDKLLAIGDTVLRQDLNAVGGAARVGLSQGGKIQQAISWLTPEMFGATGGNASVDTPAIIAALAAGQATGRCVEFDSSKIYAINSAISVTLAQGQSLRVNFNGAKFHQIGNIVPFTFANSLASALTAVSSVTKVAVDLGNGGVNTYVSMMVAPGHSFVVGDIAKIFSNDTVPDSDGSGQMLGEWFVVGKVDGDNVYATGVLVEAFASGMYLAKPSNARLHIETGLYLYSDPSLTSNASGFNVRGFIRPMLPGVFEGNDLNATFFNLTGCYFAQVGTVIGDSLNNEPVNLQYGYVFNDSGSYGTQVDTLICNHARHGFTTSTPTRVPGDGRWDLSGRSMFPKVRNVIMQGNANGVDTHSPAYRPHFGTITVINDYRGNDTGGAGLQIRGNSARIDTLEVINSKVGLAVSSASKTSDSFISIGQVRIKSEQGCLPVSITGLAGFRNKVVIDNLDVETSHDSVMLVTDSNVIVKYLNLRFSPYQNGAEIFELAQGAVVDCLDGDVYINAGTVHYLATHAADLTTIRAKLRVTGASRLAYLAQSASQYSIDSEWEVHLDAWAGTPFLGLNATSPKPFAMIRVGSTQYPLRIRSLTTLVTGNNTIALQSAGDPVVFLRIQTSTSAVVINSISKGAYVGQMLVVNNHTASTQTITLADNSGGLLVLGSSVVLAIGGSTQLIWDGSNWRRAS